MEQTPVFTSHWYDSLQFKMSTIFLALLVLIMVSVTMVLKTIGSRLVEEEAYLKLEAAEREVITELEKRTVLSATLADALANLAEKLSADTKLNKELSLQLMDYKGTEELIAGGGIWPAPYQFDPDLERHSFFWGRNREGVLEFYDDYNQPEGKGYHNEEWYVPAKYLHEGGVYWSKSYTDPYSLQPMVTVTVPMYQQGLHIGASTIDLKLEGLQNLLEKVTKAFGGYAFAVDRNGTFLSYPDNELVLVKEQGSDGSQLKSFINYRQLAARLPEFATVAEILDRESQRMVQSRHQQGHNTEKLAEKLANESYQITPVEAEVIAVTLNKTSRPGDSPGYKRTNVFLKSDYLLKEPVYISIATMPNTFWKIVTVMPYSHGVQRIATTYNRLMIATCGAVFVALLLVWFLIRRSITMPMGRLSKQLRLQVESETDAIELINTPDNGELGALAHWFNRRTRQLMETQKKIEKLAHFDSLTGLPNRRLLIDRLENRVNEAKRQGSFGALLFIDIDNFKLINDSLGHDMGDELLMQVAERLQKCLRREDTVARLGGDEFVVLIVKNSSFTDQLIYETTVVANKLVKVIRKPFDLRGRLHHITSSIGITIFPSSSSSSDELLRQADTAMYRSKARGKNGFCFFKPEMQEEANKRLNTEEELRQALVENQLSLVYQPQVDINDTCLCAEALVRWTHPTKGLQVPGEFIAVAEESGLIIPLGNWVIDEACRQIRAWRNVEYVLEKVAVNVSPKQFRDSKFIDSVKKSVEKHKINPSQLTLEVTEGVVIDNVQNTIDKMQELKTFGVRISMDDFGTGYSSLMYLKKLPLDQLKIDQSFVRDITIDPNDAMIVETIIAMSNHLGLDVIAEGVENREQRDFLVDKGCRKFQGYYFGKPMSATAFMEYLQKNKTDTGQPRATLNNEYHDFSNTTDDKTSKAGAYMDMV